jgi:diguanylate cyclase (GGDEF)-like protein
MHMNYQRTFNSIFTRQLILGLCLVIFGVAAIYYTLAQFLREDMGTVVEAQQLALATYVARDIDNKVVQRQALLDRLAASLPPELLERPDELRSWLKERFEYQPLFSVGLFVTNAQGIPIADYPVWPERGTINYADRDYFQAGLAGRSIVGRPVIGRAAKEPVLPMGAPIKNKAGEVKAVLVGVTAFSTPGFLDTLLKSRIGETTGGFLLISPQDKLFLAASQPDMVLKPTPPPGVNPLHDKAMAGYRGTGVTVNAKGVEEVSAMVTVPSTNWFVVARLPSKEAFVTVTRTKYFLVKSAIVIILLFAILSSIGLYFVFRPLFVAATRADRMTHGELPLEPLPVVRNDEVGHLISAFNRLLSKLNDNRAELAHLAHHDGLTGLPNRALLSDRLHQVLAQAQRRNTQAGLLFMDLDGFKHINDTLGHEAGDEVLRQVSKRFSRIVRGVDTLARVGGDEFVLLLSDLADNAEEAAGIVADKCIDALKAPFLVSGKPCMVGVSIGIALGNGKTSADTLLLTADHAMYAAKKAGRGRYVTQKLNRTTVPTAP